MVDKDFNIHIKETGSDGVVSAFDRIDAAADEAGKSADDMGNKATAAGGKMANLGETLKAGAGQAAGAAAASVGLATALNENLSPAASQSIGALSALGGVASAFGPWGQLVAAGASLAATAIALFTGEAEEAYEVSYSLSEQWKRDGLNSSFFARSIGQVSAAFEDAAEKANTAKAASDAFFASVGGASLLPEGFRRGGVVLTEVVKATEGEVKKLQDTLDQLYAGQASGIGDYSEAIQNTSKLLADQQAILRAQQAGLANYTKAAKAAVEGSTGALASEVVAKAAAGGKSAGTAAGESWITGFYNTVSQGISGAVSQAFTKVKTAYDEQMATEQRLSDGLIAIEVERGRGLMEADKKTSEDRKKITEETSKTAEEAAKKNEEFFNMYSDAVTGSLQNAATAALLSGAQFEEVLNQQLQVMSIAAAFDALRSTATGFYRLAIGDVGGATAAFTSAGMFAALAAGAAAGAVVTGGFGQGPAGLEKEEKGGVQSSRDLGPSGGNGGGGPVVNNYIIENTGVLGLSSQLARTFAEGTRQQNIRQGGIKTNTRRS
jgi:hypothetical protein